MTTGYLNSAVSFVQMVYRFFELPVIVTVYKKARANIMLLSIKHVKRL